MRKQSKSAQITRRELTNAARELFAEKGYEATSIQDIIQKAEYSIGAFYGHFKSKQAMAEAVYSEEMLALQARSVSCFDTVTSPEELVDMLLFFVNEGRDNPLISLLPRHIHVVDSDAYPTIMENAARHVSLLCQRIHTFYPQTSEETVHLCANGIQSILNAYSNTTAAPMFSGSWSKEDIRQLLLFLLKMCQTP